MATSGFKMKTIHEVVTRNDVVVSERTYEVIDHDAYWYLDHEGNPKPEGVTTGFVFDKEEHPLLKNAQDAYWAWVAKKRQEREQMAADAKEHRRQQRLERKAARHV